MIPAVPLWSARVLALVGFLDATYLTVSHYAGQGLACGPEGGCGLVTTSRFATVAGVPIAAIGVGYYVVVSLLAWTPPTRWGPGTSAALLAITGAAALVSSVLVYLQAAVIEAWCRFCLLSAAVAAALLLAAVLLFRGARRPPSGHAAPNPVPSGKGGVHES